MSPDPLVVREHARISVGSEPGDMDGAQITAEEFEWLCRLRNSAPGGAQLVQVEDRRHLRLDSFVGVLETPKGRTIEILPKHVAGAEGVTEARRMVIRALAEVAGLRRWETGPAWIEAFDEPAPEWVIRAFLMAADRLIHRGLRRDYRRIEAESRHLRGQLDMRRQLRQPPGRRHRFQVAHDIFTPDRPENRLIRLALDKSLRLTRDATNWRLARELATLFDEIPPSSTIERDLGRWEDSRLMAAYRPIRPWCELLLRDRTPLSQSGSWRGRSMLFPMEQLFELWVARCIELTLAPGFRVKEQPQSEHLATHMDQNWFRLKPDLTVIERGETKAILDTKWKILDANRSSPGEKYGLAQSDLYQMFAYGQKYLRGEGDLFLIYPRSPTFTKPLPPFWLADELRLWVVPFDLSTGSLVDGPWSNESPWATPEGRTR